MRPCPTPPPKAPRPTLAAPLVLIALLAAACAGEQGGESGLRELPDIREPMPEEPTPADEGKAGNFVRLETEAGPLRAFTIEPEGEAKAGLLLVHGVWGLDEDLRELARDLAAEGYAVVAPDLFEGVVSTTRLSHEDLLSGVGDELPTRALLAGAERAAALAGEAGAPVALVTMRAGAGWGFAFAAQHPELVEAMVVDHALLDAALVPEGGISFEILLLAGEYSKVLDEATLARLEQDFAARGTELEVIAVRAAGTDLLDPDAMGHSAVSRPIAMDALLAFLDERVGQEPS